MSEPEDTPTVTTTAELPAVTDGADEDTATFPPVEDTVTLPVTAAEPETAAATGGAPAGVVMATFPAIGGLPALSLPAVGILSCGHCGDVFTPASLDAPRRRDAAGGWTTAPWDGWEASRLLYQLRCLAYAAGWEYDAGMVLTCPACRAAETAHAARVHSLETRPGRHFPDIFAPFDAWVAVFVAERDEPAETSAA